MNTFISHAHTGADPVQALVYIDLEGDGTDPRFEATLVREDSGLLRPWFARPVVEQIVAWNNRRCETDPENPVMEFDGDVLRITSSDMHESNCRPDDQGRYAVGAEDGWEWKQDGQSLAGDLAPLVEFLVVNAAGDVFVRQAGRSAFLNMARDVIGSPRIEPVHVAPDLDMYVATETLTRSDGSTATNAFATVVAAPHCDQWPKLRLYAGTVAFVGKPIMVDFLGESTQAGNESISDDAASYVRGIVGMARERLLAAVNDV